MHLEETFIKTNGPKRICNVLFGASDTPDIAFKDCGMFLYNLAKDFNWQSTYVYFKTRETDTKWNELFCSYVKPICIGDTSDYKEQVKIAKRFLQENAQQFDVIMFYNYGSTIWKLARLCKKINPNITIYSKLDMSNGGFSHFCGNKSFMGIRNYAEKIKSRYVDVFSVETRSYYEALSKTSVFKNRIGLIPNGVSMLDVNISNIDNLEKENIVITIGRLGTHQKNNELLLEAIKLLPEELVCQWKFIFIGPSTNEFIELVEAFKLKNSKKANSIMMTGSIIDRNKIYEYCKKAKIMCMTSRYESTCLVTLEAMYFGAYPVITDYSEFTIDTTDGGKYGTVVELENVTALVKALVKTMSDKDLVSKGKKCQEYARKTFGYDELASKLNSLLRRFL